MKRTLLLLTILILGCTSTTETRPGSNLPAVVITDYNFDQDTIRQGQTTGVSLVIQNLGDEKARNIKTKLFRLGEGIAMVSTNVQSADLMNPPDEAIRTPGESKEFTWQIEAIPLSTDKKTTKSYNIGVLVGYDYKSEGWSDLLATTKEQAKIDQNQIPSLKSGSTQGPLTVNVITPNSILYGTDEKVTVRADVINGGGGITYAGRSGPDGVVGNSEEMNKIKSIEIRMPRSYTKLDATVGSNLGGGLWCCKPGCDAKEDSDYVWILDNSDPDYLKLRKDYTGPVFSPYADTLTLLRGQQKSYVCYFLIDKTKVPEQQIVPIRATAEYSYSTEDSRILVVEGVK